MLTSVMTRAVVRSLGMCLVVATILVLDRCFEGLRNGATSGFMLISLSADPGDEPDPASAAFYGRVEELIRLRRAAQPAPPVWRRVYRNFVRWFGGGTLTPSELTEQTHQELANLVTLRLDIQRIEPTQKVLQREVDAAISLSIAALETDPPSLDFARTIRKDIEGRVAYAGGAGRVVAGAMVSAGLALVIAVIISVGVPFGLPDTKAIPFMGATVWDLWWYGLIGAFGGVVSILLRIPDFARLNRHEASVQFLAGVFRGVIGGFFALFTYFVLRSGALGLTVKVTGEQETAAFYVAICFLAGFSERLAPTLANRSEQQILGDKGHATSAR